MKKDNLNADIDNRTEKLEFTPAMLVRLRDLVSGGGEDGIAPLEGTGDCWYKINDTVWRRYGWAKAKSFED